MRRRLAKAGLGALGHGGAGGEEGKHIPHSLFVQLGSTPKSRAAPPKWLFKCCELFSESALLGFKMKSSARFRNVLLQLTHAYCSLMAPKKEV